ncbi:hypothetical protein [Marinobacterium aestuariivivens]|uniref:HypF Kae1-like domain-containing protein n=1 Tax=Marinobacterium aestuariivivens TaxID=1698799 RepID=A0ABW2A1X2_9GAMM
MIDGEPRLLRRARGYAPAEFALPAGLATADGVLALGGDLKNVPCLVRQGRAALAPHLGDLDQPQILQQLQDSCDQLVSLLDCVPRLIVCDPHPGYFSRRRHRPWRSTTRCR